ncbi:hypothetical protein VP249E411_P0234 [Vibrio phage 249E41-1]|nr:hypothetical protein VP249E411_P0234 [Vibrio phage 249E41-1]
MFWKESTRLRLKVLLREAIISRDFPTNCTNNIKYKWDKIFEMKSSQSPFGGSFAFKFKNEREICLHLSEAEEDTLIVWKDWGEE